MDREPYAVTFSAPPSFTTRPTLRGTFGAVASTHWIATASAQAILERGGNAFDAAAAGGFVLHLAEPHLNGPGGDLVGLFATGDDPDRIRVLMGQGAAPAGATIGHMRDEGLDAVPGSGALAATIPAGVDAWLLLLREHGTLPLADVLAPAVAYARSGIPLLPSAAAVIARVSDLFRSHWPTSAAHWLPDDRAPAADDLVANPVYAGVLEELAAAADAGGASRAERIEAARRAWAERLAAAAPGFLAAPHRHSSGRDHAGVLTAADFTAFPARIEEPLTQEFRGRTVAKAGTWSQGPVLLQALGMLDPLPDAALDPSTTDGAHTILEALKLCLADRDAHLGDGVDAAPLLAESYLADRRALIGPRASAEWRPGAPTDAPAWRPPLNTPTSDVAGQAGVGEPTVERSGRTRGDTCHIDVVDRWGNVVAVTPSGGWLQSSPTIPGLGFCLGTRLQMTWLDPTSPSALRPGFRPRTTLSPTIIRDGPRTIALGTPGGDQQDQWQLPAILRMLVGGWSGQAALDAPTLHTTAVVDSFWPRTWIPGGAVAESPLGDDVLDALEARGHRLVRSAPWSLGRLSAAGTDRETGTVWAAANPRGMQGYAAGR